MSITEFHIRSNNVPFFFLMLNYKKTKFFTFPLCNHPCVVLSINALFFLHIQSSLNQNNEKEEPKPS